MAFIERDVSRRPVIDLAGPDGNAFVLIATAQKFLKQLGVDNQYIAKIGAEMMNSDYENLLQVFERELGDFVDLIRP